MRSAILLVSLASLALGCTAEKKEQAAPAEAQPAADAQPAAQPAAEAAVYDAICGHALESVGHCGNYIKVGGEYVVLEYPSLGSMEFCADGEKGAKVKVAGVMRDGKFVASSYERVE